MSYLDDPIFGTTLISGHAMPGTWRYMLPEDFALLKLPEERLATCDNCPMVVVEDYLPSCKCCTHFAQIPNFQLGLALKDPRTRERTQGVIRKGYALPEGLQITPTHLVSSVEAYVDDLFGKSEALRCPFADTDSGGCGIYAFRNAICSTFHCGHDHCGVGVRFWERIEDLVGQVETAVSQWAMGAVGMDPSRYIDRCNQLADRVATLSGDSPKVWSPSAQSHLWGSWLGREEAFFEACADQVMEKRDELWQIACEQPLLVALDYDIAVDALLPVKDLTEIQTIPKNPGEPIAVTDLWYKLQLAARRLWELPYNDGQVVLSGQVVIGENPRNDPVSRLYEGKPFKATLSKKNDAGRPLEVFLTRTETIALRLFETPKTIGEALLERPEITDLEHPRDFLAECMRSELLVPLEG